MNLVQINERLKDLPMQVIQQYANGMNPEVPPYLALSELQRRESSQKQAAATQGGAQGQPSIKEQLEQKAGLMALQQAQQQQMQQQQPRGPMPAPAGVPQPQMQPQAMMARGGLAGIPVRRDMFEYAGGGIIAFANGGDTMGTPSLEQQELTSQAAEITDEMLAEKINKAKIIAQLEEQLQFLTNAGSPKAEGVRAQLERVKGPERAPAAPADASFRRQPDPRTTGTPATKQPLITSNAAPRVNIAQKPPALNAGPNVNSGLKAAAASRSPYFAQADAALNEPNIKPTPESIIAEQRALSPEAMQEEFMKKRMAEQRERATGERAAFEKSRPSGLDDLIRVFGQAGQYKGGTGLAPAYTANQQQKRAEELAMERRQNELLTAVDTREYEGGKELFGARSKAMDKANESFQNRLKSRAETLAQLAGVDERRIQSELDRLSQMEIQKLRMAEAARGTPDQQLFAQFLKLKSEGKTKEAQRLLDSLDEFKGAGKNQTDQILKMKLEPIYKARVEAAGMPGEIGAKKLAELDRMEQAILRGANPAGGSATPLPANASPANLTVGTVYQTAKGPAKWTGTGFAPV